MKRSPIDRKHLERKEIKLWLSNPTVNTALIEAKLYTVIDKPPVHRMEGVDP